MIAPFHEKRPYWSTGIQVLFHLLCSKEVTVKLIDKQMIKEIEFRFNFLRSVLKLTVPAHLLLYLFVQAHVSDISGAHTRIRPII